MGPKAYYKPLPKLMLNLSLIIFFYKSNDKVFDFLERNITIFTKPTMTPINDTWIND